MHAGEADTPVPGTYFVECYRPGLTGAAIREAVARTHAAASEICERGNHVQLLHSTFVADDEAVLSTFQADSVEAVREASENAGLPVDRISLAEDVDGPPPRTYRETPDSGRPREP